MVYHSLEEMKMFMAVLGQWRRLCSPSAASGPGVSLGGPGRSKACPWSPACSEVTPGCVETTLVKRHGNAVGCHPHRAPGDESADAGSKTAGLGPRAQTRQGQGA